MKVDVSVPGPLRHAGREARRLEEAGYDGVWAVREGFSAHDGAVRAR